MGYGGRIGMELLGRRLGNEELGNLFEETKRWCLFDSRHDVLVGGPCCPQ